MSTKESTVMGRESGSGLVALTDALAQVLGRPIIQAAEAAHLGIGVSVVEGGDARRIYVSDAAADILGYPVEELIGESTFITFPPEEVERLRELNRRWLDGGQIPFFIESVILRKDGRRIPVEVSYTPVELDGKRAMVSFLRDISDRKRSEDALRRSEELFRKLIEAAPEAVAVSRKNTIVYGNPRFLQLLGYDRIEEMAERNVQLLHPAERSGVPERMRRLIDTSGEASAEAPVYRMLRKDGTVLFVECSSLAIEFEGAPAFLTFMRDVTKYREEQAQLLQTERMATMGRIAAGVAHELNNPLGYVMLNLDLLAHDLQSKDIGSTEHREQMREKLRIIEEGTRHMASIVQDLLGFCRPDVPPHPIDVRRVLESAISMTRKELGATQLVRDYMRASFVLADGARLGQVFSNLLMNAVQARRKDEESEVRVVLRPQGTTHIRVEIRDSGVGIAPELLERIFEPFFTTKPPGIGTGLGLSISRSIIDGMHGQLSVESTPGRGSTFRVVLPSTGNIDVPAARSKTLRVLIVDEEPLLDSVLTSVLEGGHEVVALSSGEKALEMLREEATFDLVLCGAPELLQEIERTHPSCRVVLIDSTIELARLEALLDR